MSICPIYFYRHQMFFSHHLNNFIGFFGGVCLRKFWPPKPPKFSKFPWNLFKICFQAISIHEHIICVLVYCIFKAMWISLGVNRRNARIRVPPPPPPPIFIHLSKINKIYIKDFFCKLALPSSCPRPYQVL